MKLYKFKNLQGDGLYYSLDMIVNERVYLGTRDQMNDPEEGQWGVPSEGGALESFTMDKIKIFVDAIDKQRFTCFTKDCDNTLLWAHYAGGFSGVCFEYELSETENDIRPIVYSGGARISTDDINDVILGSRSILDIGCLQSKSYHWKYEDEYRVFSKDVNQYIQARPDAVILGTRKSMCDSVLPNIIRKYGIKVGYLTPSEWANSYAVEYVQNSCMPAR